MFLCISLFNRACNKQFGMLPTILVQSPFNSFLVNNLVFTFILVWAIYFIINGIIISDYNLYSNNNNNSGSVADVSNNNNNVTVATTTVYHMTTMTATTSSNNKSIAINNLFKDIYYDDKSFQFQFNSIVETSINDLKFLQKNINNSIIMPLISENKILNKNISDIISNLYSFDSYKSGNNIQNISLNFINDMLNDISYDIINLKKLNFTKIKQSATTVSNLNKRNFFNSSSQLQNKVKIISIVIPIIYIILSILIFLYRMYQFKLSKRQFNKLLSDFLNDFISNNEKENSGYYDFFIFFKNIQYKLSSPILNNFKLPINNASLLFFSNTFINIVILTLIMIIYYTQIVSLIISSIPKTQNHSNNTTSLHKRDITSGNYISIQNSKFTNFFNNNISYKNKLLPSPKWINITSQNKASTSNSQLMKRSDSYRQYNQIQHNWNIFQEWIYLSYGIFCVVYLFIGFFLVPFI